MKKIICFLLSMLLLLCIPTAAGATGDDFSVGQTWDDSILAGGIYDMYAWVGENPDDYTFQWQVDVGFGEGRWSDLEDNADPYGYAGTDTYHLQLITPRTNGYIIGTGWENIPFQCVITNKKTGVTKSTASMFMKVFTSDDLEELMAEKGIELYTPGVDGASKSTTTDDITYYTTAEAGKPLKFLCGFNPPQNNQLMGRSDMVGNVELWITENGKTVRCEDGAAYMPYTIGKNAVTAEFKLHYTLGIHDLGYYQTKTLKLSTSEPTIVGRGTAKQEMSLLKEPYSQPQKLITIPRGASVNVHTNSGSWYQVSYNGHVGYVAGSSLNYENYRPIIEHVDVTISEPVAGALPATSCSVSPDSCYVTSVEWLDKTSDHFMELGERFQQGHQYQLVIWATAKDGYEFKLDGSDRMLTTAIINDTLPAYTSRAYEQIIGKVIDIRFDFSKVHDAPEPHTCVPVLVPKVEPTCTQSGKEAYYCCKCGMCYSDPQGKNAVDISTWGKIAALGHLETAYQSDADTHYMICGRQGCGEELSKYRGAHTGGNATCMQNGKCLVCGYAYQERTDHRWSPKYHPVDATGHAYQCADCKEYDTLVPHEPGPEATDTEPQRCTVCQYILVPAGNHTHKLTKVEAVAATCLTPGSQAYYTCDGCEDWFRDEAGNERILDRKDIILEPLGHFAERWQADGENHWQSCIVCLTEITREKHQDNDHNGMCDICDSKIGEGPTQTDPKATEKEEERSAQPDDPAESPQTIEWYLWVLLFLVMFAASLTATVIILKKRNES